MIVMSYGIRMTDAFSIYHPRVSDANHRVGFSSENSLSASQFRDNSNLCHTRIFRIYASTNGINSQNQSIGDRSYDFIAIEEADKMLQKERLRNEKEIREMKILLERQHEELLEFDRLTSNVRLSNQDYIDTINRSYFEGQDSKCSDDTKQSGINNDKPPFPPPFSASIDEEKYKQKYQSSHNTAELRTLKISLQQIDDENEELEKEFDDQQHRYQSDIADTQRMISDIRDRFDCMQHELKLEILHFESTKTDLENMFEEERSKSRDFEQQLIVAHREQEILEQAAVEAAVEAKKRQQELHEQEVQDQIEYRQRIMQLEHKEHEHHQQQHIKQEQERYHDKDLLSDHEELVELDLHQKQFDDLYFNLRDDNRMEESIGNQNQSQLQQDVVAINSGQRPHQYKISVDLGAPEIYPPQPMQSPCYDRTQKRHFQQEHSFSAAVTTEASENLPSKRESKHYSRKNSHAHGMFMNFNDILV